MCAEIFIPLRLRVRSAPLRYRWFSTNGLIRKSSRFPLLDTLRHNHSNCAFDDFDLDRPALLKGYSNLPATLKWDYGHLRLYGSAIVPLELTREDGSFQRFEAPLSLLLDHMESPETPRIRLYLAQCPLDDLPTQLQADLPTPKFISSIGKGDIYGSSLWMGRPPTRTPLHRDPNPNFFVQLAGNKIFRLMEPDIGKQIYMRARRGSGHAHMRGEEMMAGEEMTRLEDAVWGGTNTVEWPSKGWEAQLESGDALYIPLGWWHAVRGLGQDVNASVNWWFR